MTDLRIAMAIGLLALGWNLIIPRPATPEPPHDLDDPASFAADSKQRTFLYGPKRTS